MPKLPIIPVVDIRDGGPVIHAERHRETALAVRRACFSSAPRMAEFLAPLADRFARSWLDRSASPYRDEIAQIATGLGVAGAYTINTSYEWSCTARATGTRLRRTLDWPFPGLGRYVHVAIQAGPAGLFYNVGWPGSVGVLTGLAPGRFAAAINQAPLRRVTPLRVLDYARNALTTWRTVRHIPPMHLLRQVFETAPDFSSACRTLATIPIARPVLFTLTGLTPDQACLIERTETTATIHQGPITAANDWQVPDERWEARVCVRGLPDDNTVRIRTLAAADESKDFDWVVPPVRNANTRVAVVMDAAENRLAVLGFERISGTDAAPATEPLMVQLESV